MCSLCYCYQLLFTNNYYDCWAICWAMTIFAQQCFDMATTRIILDHRKANKDEKYPIKLRVIHNREKMLFRVEITLDDKEKTVISSLTDADFAMVHNSKPENPKELSFKDKEIYKQINLKLAEKETLAINLIKKLPYFTFDAFRNEFLKGDNSALTEDSTDVFIQYKRKIASLEAREKIGTASSYKLSMKSIKRFILFEKGKEPASLKFGEITADWLVRYEAYMLKEDRSKTTVGIYMRNLRHLFNLAIKQKAIADDLYPFRKGSNENYRLPTGIKVKKALTKEQLGNLFETKPSSIFQQKAKDFFFFSYICNGMNIKDIALLRFEQLGPEFFWFEREKTKDTISNPKRITVPLVTFSKNVIKKYQTKNGSPDDFVFSIISKTDDAKERRRKIQKFTRFINQHVKALAASIGISKDISVQFARHSFVTRAVQEGFGLEFVGEALGHTDVKTTQSYFAGFEDSTKRELSEKLLNFGKKH